MRPVSRSTKELMAEINRLNPKYRKYLDGIAEACRLAHEYQSLSAATRTLSKYNRRLTSTALEVGTPSNICSATAETANISKADQSGNGSSSSQAPQSKLLAEQNNENGNDPQDSSVQSGKDSSVEGAPVRADIKHRANIAHQYGGGRPRRKRKKSTRYQGFLDPFDTRVLNRKRQSESGNDENRRTKVANRNGSSWGSESGGIPSIAGSIGNEAKTHISGRQNLVEVKFREALPASQ